MFTVQQPFNFIFIDKVNEEVKNIENHSHTKVKRGSDWGKDIYSCKYLYKSSALVFSCENLPLCLQLHPVLDSREHLDDPVQSHRRTFLHSETISQWLAETPAVLGLGPQTQFILLQTLSSFCRSNKEREN